MGMGAQRKLRLSHLLECVLRTAKPQCGGVAALSCRVAADLCTLVARFFAVFLALGSTLIADLRAVAAGLVRSARQCLNRLVADIGALLTPIDNGLKIGKVSAGFRAVPAGVATFVAGSRALFVFRIQSHTDLTSGLP
jgi:hypothetical protein